MRQGALNEFGGVVTHWRRSVPAGRAGLGPAVFSAAIRFRVVQDVSALLGVWRVGRLCHAKKPFPERFTLGEIADRLLLPLVVALTI